MSNEFFTLRVNGTDHDVADSWLGESLLDVLRDRIGLVGSKGACTQGECGSCSVMVDGALVCSCLVMGASAVGQEIVTIEGVAPVGALLVLRRPGNVLGPMLVAIGTGWNLVFLGIVTAETFDEAGCVDAASWVTLLTGTFSFALLWLFAAFISRDGTERSDRLAPSRLRVASTQTASDLVVEEGPIIFPGLGTTTGERTLVLDHTGDDPDTGWTVYFAYPASRDPSCIVEQVIGTRDFIDCDGNTIDVSDLAPPPAGVNPIVEDSLLSIDLSGVTE